MKKERGLCVDGKTYRNIKNETARVLCHDAVLQEFVPLCWEFRRQDLIHWTYGCSLWFLVFGVHEMEMRSLIALAIVNWATNAVRELCQILRISLKDPEFRVSN